jgi:hypothetical protein
MAKNTAIPATLDFRRKVKPMQKLRRGSLIIRDIVLLPKRQRYLGYIRYKKK